MEEAQSLCSRVLILDRGRTLALGPPAELVDRHGPGSTIRFSTRADASLGFFLRRPGVEGHATVGGDPWHSQRSVTIRTLEPELVMQETMSARLHGLTVGDLRLERASLEDVFLELTGRDIRD